MAVDLLRSCYSTDMQFFEGVDFPIPVQWYWCEPDAKPLPMWTRFASGNWASERTNWFGTGEVLGAPRPWRNGKAPRNACGDVVFGRFTGQHFDGPAESFAVGCQWGDTPLETTPAGLTPECMPLPQKCYLTVLERRDPSPDMCIYVGDRITLYHPNQLPFLPLDLLWLADFFFFWQFGICGPLQFGFGCHGLVVAIWSDHDRPFAPDLIAPDQRSFYWDTFPIYGKCNPFPTAENWRCVLTFQSEGFGMANLFTFNAVNLDVVNLDAGTAVAVHPSGLGVVRAHAAAPIAHAIGLTTAPIAPLASGPIQLGGMLALPDWSLVTGFPDLIPDALYYLDPIFPGHFTTLAPSTPGQISQLVGHALDVRTLVIDALQPILL